MNDAPSSRFEREVRNVVVGGLVFMLFLAGVSLVLMRNMSEWGIRQSLARFRAETGSLAELVARAPDPREALTSEAGVASRLDEAEARAAGLYDAAGNRVAEAAFLPDAALAPARLPSEDAPAAGAVRARDLSGESPPLVVCAVTLAGRSAPVAPTDRSGSASAGSGTWTLRVAYDGTAVAAAHRNVKALSAVVPAAALALVVLVIPFLRRVVRPIEALTETARDAGAVVPSAAAPGARDEAEHAIATFARTVEELRKRTSELEVLQRREKERADALAVTAETLVRSHPGGLLVVDAEGRLSEANPPALAALDLAADAVGRPAVQVLEDVPPLLEAVRNAAAGLPTLAKEFAAGDTSEARRLAVTAVPVVDAAGKALGTLLFLEDRTTTARLQRELSARRELAALGEMSAGIAHEFRNATATILGYARLAATTEDEKARQRQLAAIKNEAQHVARVTGDFLFFARPERLTPERTELGPIVTEIVEEERVAAPGLSIETSGAFGAAMVDAALFRRALVNLLRNAREAAGAGGRPGRVVIRGEGVLEGNVRLSVEDDGEGVPEENVPRVFVPFFSTKESGTGLGLPLVARIAALHGGSVFVERSAQLGGARFVVTLPAA